MWPNRPPAPAVAAIVRTRRPDAEIRIRQGLGSAPPSPLTPCRVVGKVRPDFDPPRPTQRRERRGPYDGAHRNCRGFVVSGSDPHASDLLGPAGLPAVAALRHGSRCGHVPSRHHPARSEEHTYELQSLLRISYAVL